MRERDIKWRKRGTGSENGERDGEKCLGDGIIVRYEWDCGGL